MYTFIDLLLNILVVLEEIIFVVVELVDRNRCKGNTDIRPTAGKRVMATRSKPE